MENFQQISVMVKKDGFSKWLCADFFHMNNQSQINNMYFTSNYEKEKQLKAAGRMAGTGSTAGYLGPDLSSLEESLEQGILEFIESLGFKPEMIEKIAEYSIAYEHKFYIQWLKDMNSLL